ncbi:MAG: Gfo/Idh/MocA family oxidoreductase [Planctomyces sp.]|nr:Gfo/Idh/MocA family oxidoreductase [Planctomyces sp.]
MRLPASRREFMKASSALGAALFVGGPATRTVLAQARSANERVRYACIGVGGKGDSDSNDAAQHGDVVAVCDVDSTTLNDKAQKLESRTKVKPATYADFRKLLDEMKDKIDAVTVSTPDHCHAHAAALAMKMGKACFCQKPLTHSVWEARRLQEIAAEMDVATSMGNQGTQERALREAAAILKAGHLGQPKEVHVTTNRPVWPQGGPRSASKNPPANLDWNLWLGPAPIRPYADNYHTFAWRGWWDFGTGALGDMACHTFNMPYMGVGLKDPVSIQATCSGHNGDSYPQSSKIKFEFPEAEGRGPVTVWWYDGGNEPDESIVGSYKFKRGGDGKTTGAVIVCEKGILYSWGDYGGDFVVLSPEGQPIDKPKVEYERSPGHFTEFHESVTGERKRAVGNFENYSGRLTETILLGNLAVWAAATGESKVIEWDAKTLTPTNAPEVEQIVQRGYRKGYQDIL